jgi:hypothetical protein
MMSKHANDFKHVWEIDPHDIMERLAHLEMARADWQGFQRILDSLMIEPRPPHEAIDREKLIEVQMARFPTSQIIPVEEAFAKWCTDFYSVYQPYGSFHCYVHNRCDAVFYEIHFAKETAGGYRGARYGMEDSEYMSGFGAMG